jgi:hypothetical protein
MGLQISEPAAQELASEINAKLKERYRADSVRYHSMDYDEDTFVVHATEVDGQFGTFSVELFRPWDRWHPRRTESFYEGSPYEK